MECDTAVGSRWRTVVAPVTLSGADHRRAHEACHAAAGLWNQAVDWVHRQWAIRQADVAASLAAGSVAGRQASSPATVSVLTADPVVDAA